MSVENIPLLIGLGFVFLVLAVLALKLLWGIAKLAFSVGVVAVIICVVIIAGFWIVKTVHYFT